MFGYFFWTEGEWPQSKPQLASPPAPLRMERGVICEVTPIGLLKEGEGMPDGRRESYEAVPRRPEQQGTKGPALSMSPVCSVPLLPCLLLQATCLPVYSSTYQLATLPCLKHTLSLSQPSVTPRTCSSVTLSFSYPVLLSTLPCLLIHLTLPLPCHKKSEALQLHFLFLSATLVTHAVEGSDNKDVFRLSTLIVEAQSILVRHSDNLRRVVEVDRFMRLETIDNISVRSIIPALSPWSLPCEVIAIILMSSLHPLRF